MSCDKRRKNFLMYKDIICVHAFALLNKYNQRARIRLLLVFPFFVLKDLRWKVIVRFGGNKNMKNKYNVIWHCEKNTLYKYRRHRDEIDKTPNTTQT